MRQGELIPDGREKVNDVFTRLGYTRTPSVEGIALSYLRLPKHEVTQQHELHYAALGSVLYGALSTYAAGLNEVFSEPRVNEYRFDKLTQNYQRVTESAKRLAFPDTVLEPLSKEFIDFSVNNPNNVLPLVRYAAADMGMALGNDSLYQSKVRTVATHHVNAMDGLRRKTAIAEHEFRAELTQRMLHSLEVRIDITNKPSLVETVTKYTKDHARSVTTTGVTALIAASILSPSVTAHANEATPSVQTIPGVDNDTGFTVAPVIVDSNEAQAAPEISTISGSNEAVSSLDAVVSMPDQSLGLQLPELDAPMNVTAPSVQEKIVTVLPSMNVDTPIDTEPVIPVTEVFSAPAPLEEVIATIAPVIEPTPAVDQADKTIELEPAPEVITVAPEPTPEVAPDPNAAPPTLEQQVAQSVKDTLNNSGDIMTAVSLLRMTFHGEGQDASIVTNEELVSKVRDLQAKHQVVMNSGGHTDAEYVNTALMALAVLDAAANDQTILQSSDVQGLLAAVVRPTGDYEGKLFDQYLGLTKMTLQENDSSLLGGIDEQHRAQIELMYTYALMASYSDSELAAQMQTIKDEEAKEAAKKAAEKEKHKRGDHLSEDEENAIDHLIDKAPKGVKKRMYMAMKFFLEKGLTANQAAGIIGNLYRESAGTFDAGIKQFGGGPGRGIAQWEGGRFDALVEYAEARGHNWDNFLVQLSFLWQELDGGARGWAYEPLKSADTLTDATHAFLKHFETPAVVIHGTPAQIKAENRARAGFAEPVLRAYKKQLEREKGRERKLDRAIDEIVDKNGWMPRSFNVAGYAPGNCTAWVAAVRDEMGSPIPSSWGNARDWDDRARAQNWKVDRKPEVGAVWQTDTLTSPGNPYGHVGIVEEVYANGSWKIREMNRPTAFRATTRILHPDSLSGSHFIHGKK